MGIVPINGHVLVEPLDAESKTAGGVYLPDSAREKHVEGKVLAVAEDATEEVAVGDRVIYKEFAGVDVQDKGEDYLLLASDDLLVKYVAADEIPD